MTPTPPWPTGHITDLRTYHNPCGWSCAASAGLGTCDISRWLATLDAALAQPAPALDCADCGGDHPSGHPWHTPPDPLHEAYLTDEDDFEIDGPDPLLEMAAKARAICRKPKGHDAQPTPALDRMCPDCGLSATRIGEIHINAQEAKGR